MNGGVSTSEAALALGVTRQAVQKMIASGALEARRVSRDATRKQWAIDRASLDQLVESRRGREVPMDSIGAAESLALAREMFTALRLAERTADDLRSQLYASRAAETAALSERDEHALTALTALEQVDSLRGELDHLRAAHTALLGAHAALFGSVLVQR